MGVETRMIIVIIVTNDDDESYMYMCTLFSRGSVKCEHVSDYIRGRALMT